MALTVEIAPDLEAAVRRLAAEEGVAPQELIVQLLRECVEERQKAPEAIPREEAALLQQIGEGLPAEVWQRYHELTAKRRDEKLTPEELAALISLSDTIEEWNARRLALLVELSRLRKVPLSVVKEELGLNTPPHA